MKQKAYQIKLNVLRKGYKSFTVSGIVLATTQSIAVATAKETLEKTLAKSNNESTVKLLSAFDLKNEFFFIAEEIQSQTEEQKQVLNK